MYVYINLANSLCLLYIRKLMVSMCPFSLKTMELIAICTAIIE